MDAKPLGYDIEIGGLVLSTNSGGNASLRSLKVERSLGSVGRCQIELAAGDAQLPMAEESLSIAVQGGSDDGGTVFTGQVRRCHVAVEGRIVQGVDGLHRLARQHSASSYEGENAGAVVRALVESAGLETATIEDGPNLDQFAIDLRNSALNQARRLSEVCGFDLCCQREGQICFQSPVSERAHHKLGYGREIISAQLRPRMGRATRVSGEGAAAAEGQARAHWLTDDLAGVSAGEDSAARQLRLSALRTGEDAQVCADAHAAAVSAEALSGRLTVIGRASLELGDTIEVDGVPEQSPLAALVDGQSLRVQALIHRLDSRGFVTEVRV